MPEKMAVATPAFLGKFVLAPPAKEDIIVSSKKKVVCAADDEILQTALEWIMPDHQEIKV